MTGTPRCSPGGPRLTGAGDVSIQGALPQGCPTGTTTLADGMCESFTSSEDSNGGGIHDVIVTPAGQVSSTSVSGARLDATLGSDGLMREDSTKVSYLRGSPGDTRGYPSPDCASMAARCPRALRGSARGAQLHLPACGRPTLLVLRSHGLRRTIRR